MGLFTRFFLLFLHMIYADCVIYELCCSYAHLSLHLVIYIIALNLFKSLAQSCLYTKITLYIIIYYINSLAPTVYKMRPLGECALTQRGRIFAYEYVNTAVPRACPLRTPSRVTGG